MSDNDGSRIDAGRLFQTRGPLTANDRSPNGDKTCCSVQHMLEFVYDADVGYMLLQTQVTLKCYAEDSNMVASGDGVDSELK